MSSIKSMVLPELTWSLLSLNLARESSVWLFYLREDRRGSAAPIPLPVPLSKPMYLER
jgi:hypothetical protein